MIREVPDFAPSCLVSLMRAAVHAVAIMQSAACAATRARHRRPTMSVISIGTTKESNKPRMVPFLVAINEHGDGVY
jgi:hypothetical protein